MEQTRPTVLLIGETDHRDFRDAVVWLREHTEVGIATSVDAALARRPHSSESWRTIILAQARPGRFSVRDVDRVTRAFPLAHYVALLGSLCEGETRSGAPWPGVARVFWHQFLARCPTELPLEVRPTSWQLPRTASETERLENMFERLPSRTPGLIAIVTRNATLYDALSGACQAVGYSTVSCAHDRMRSFRGAVAAIWDGESQGHIEFAELERVASNLLPVPTVALLSFPRYDQLLQARKCGAHAVVSSPFLLPDLWNTIHAAVREAKEEPVRHQS